MEFPPPPPERSKRLHNFTLPYLRWGHQRSLRCVNLPSSSSSPPSPDHGERRRNLSIDLVCDGKPALGNGGGEEAEARPWNLRTRRAACNEPTRITRDDGDSEKKEKVKFSVALLRGEIEDDFTSLFGKKPPRRPKKRPRLVQNQMNTLFPGLWLAEQVTEGSYHVPDYFGNFAEFRPRFLVRQHIQVSDNVLSLSLSGKLSYRQCSVYEHLSCDTCSFLQLAKRNIMICAESNHQRISFASDLGQSDKAPPVDKQPSGRLVRRDTTLLDSSSPDFEFHISRNVDASPADEIFADGMILPFQVTTASSMPKRLYKYELPPIVSAPSSSIPPKPLPLPLPLPLPQQHYSEKGTPGSGANSDSEAEKTSKSFWSFKRSSSLNCDIKKSLICSFPRLTRSNSTGSVINSKREMLRDINKHSSQRHGAPRPGTDPSSHLSSSCSSPSSVCCSSYQFKPQKQAGKNGGRGGSFGLGSILRVLKDKKTKNK
ncbi:hypothetical protein IGI04_012031 [Brassica rapa subsp. trilocularis]|uniref:DUF3741 domain-containing protein n=1 Tax=Brassica rapa subsp. trilocularis TaxID=1813537 RepID=A0ABQ7N4S2_BRACM|nr:hypothetical protein IGI04_012031 [Brassica rapa subsp. trilocularis]